ncbi:MAG: hypothetical protein KKH29_03715, partial [Candidatus Omnitrophica bacterium]|nr:hypothetical protein [Candidatus Omnitrophota bacterium]MCG2706799.1 hypothetical protein [Candidatus Omnitrophota bacterium]
MVKRIFGLVILIGLVLGFAGLAEAGWYNPSWSYRRAITLSPVTSVADYQVKVTNPIYDETGLVGSWHFDGGTTGAIANATTAGLQDTSGNSNNGTASNVNGTGMAWTTGKADGAVSFDGVDDYVNVGN